MALARIGDAPGVSNLSGPTTGKKFSLFEAALHAAKTQGNQAAAPLATHAGSPSYAMRPLAGDGQSNVVIPEANTDPAAVAAWWESLSSETREDLIRNNNAQLGTLRGLPAEDMDRINRLRLDEDIATLTEALRTVTATINGDGALGGEVDPALYREAERLRTELSNAEEMKDQMNRLDRNHRDEGGPKPYLLTYAYQNEGRFAVALGDPDTAEDTVVVVPGAGHDVKKEGGPFPTVGEGLRLYDEMKSGAPVGLGLSDTHSVIVWLGADMPDAPAPAGLNPTYGDSEHGARWLHDDIEGYQAAITNPDNHLTILAHSYGSYMAGQAIQMGLKVDDFVVVGSPGVAANSAEELGMPGHVWAAAADGDGFVAMTGWHGNPPTFENFGATVFATDGSEIHEGSEGHGEYFKEDSESLDNIAKIATGNGDLVSRRPPDLAWFF